MDGQNEAITAHEFKAGACASQKQIIGILRGQKAGVPVVDLCRKHGLSSPTF